MRKLGIEGRGGFCYELNGAFAALLRDVGFSVDYLDARVYSDSGVGEHFEHLALRVVLDEPWLVDVGFGYSFTQPLRFVVDLEQDDPMGAFRLVDAGDGLDLEWRHRDGRWVPHYRVDLTPQPLAVFAPMCKELQVSPTSPFVTDWLCSRIDGAGGVTLFGRLLIDTKGGERTERTLTDEELPEVLERDFGVRARLVDGRWERIPTGVG